MISSVIYSYITAVMSIYIYKILHCKCKWMCVSMSVCVCLCVNLWACVIPTYDGYVYLSINEFMKELRISWLISMRMIETVNKQTNKKTLKAKTKKDEKYVKLSAWLLQIYITTLHQELITISYMHQGDSIYRKHLFSPIV